MTEAIEVAGATRLRNWAGNVTFSARSTSRPGSIRELQSIVATAAKVRVLGSGHSFNRIADTTDELVRVDRLPPIIELDSALAQVRVSAGQQYGQLITAVQAAGFALPNLASLPHISIGGACSTSTHGSGDHNQMLAASVRAVKLVTASGDVIEIDATAPGFGGSVLALGALGVMTQLTLQLVDTFQMQQFVYELRDLTPVVDSLGDVLSAAYSTSVFTDWRPGGRTLVWLKHRVDNSSPRKPEATWLGGRLARNAQHPLPGGSTESTTRQLGEVGPWNDRLPHFRLEFVPSQGAELQSEYFVARADAAAAMRVLLSLHEQLRPVLLVSEVRSIAADELWLSPAHRQETVAFHFTWIKDEPAVRSVLATLEAALAPFGALPHWGKVSVAAPASVRAGYAHFEDFRQLVAELDPGQKFRNELLDDYLSPT